MPAPLADPPKRVLIVDDHDVLRISIGAALIRDGYQIREAKDGLEALTLFDEFRPHLIVLDVLMPNLNGFETCSALRSKESGGDIPILIMTGLDDEPAAIKAYEHGATDFISKPFNYTVLSQRIRYMIRAGDTLIQLRSSERRLREARRIARLGDWEWNPASGTLTLSEEAQAALGVQGRVQDGLDGLLRGVRLSDRPRVQALLDSASEQQTLSLEHQVRLPNGELRAIHHEIVCSADEETRGIIVKGTVQDVTELKQNEERIEHLVFYDALTGLPNRAFLTQHVTRAIDQYRRSGGSGAVLCIDLDRFKRVNDTLGHGVGDELLIEVKARLLQHAAQISASGARPGAAVARMGSDEFALTLPESTPARIEQLANELLRSLGRPFLLGSEEIFLSASVGIASISAADSSAETVLRNADAAMYQAKLLGGDRFEHFSDTWRTRARARLELESGLRRALEREEFEIFYQPKVDGRSRALLGAEALLRWHRPQIGLVSPLDFIPIAEECGLIVPIGHWVITRACQQARAWLDAGMKLSIAVNIAARQFRDPDLLLHVRAALSAARLPPELLELEITEGTLMHDVRHAAEILTELRAMGVRIAIDDFGTGYSSLAYLRTLPVDTLKVDRSFVSDVTSNEDSAAIARAIVAMSKSLRLDVVAEGVETEEQFAFFAELGCNEIQGFLFSRPLSAPDFERWCQSNARQAPAA